MRHVVPGSLDHDLTRVAIFIDGGYLRKASQHYKEHVAVAAGLDLVALRKFIIETVAKEEKTEPGLCKIVDFHYFEGRYPTNRDDEVGRNRALGDRAFEDVLVEIGMTIHRLPVQQNAAGGDQEKGVDVWLALEALELAMARRYSVLALVSGDSDFVPLARKLNGLGTRVLSIGWHMDRPCTRPTCTLRCSYKLRREASYALKMEEIMGLEGTATKEGGRLLRAPAGNDAGPTVAAVPKPLWSKNVAGVIKTIDHAAGKGVVLLDDKREAFFQFEYLVYCNPDTLAAGTKVRCDVGPSPRPDLGQAYIANTFHLG